MKLEVGKYYKSRDGLKFKCVHELKSEDDYRFLTVIDDGLLHQLNNIDGFSLNSPRHDLISEWVEPVVHEVDVCFYSDGEKIHPLDNGGGMAIYEPSNGKHVPTKLIAKVKVKFTEGEGL